MKPGFLFTLITAFALASCGVIGGDNGSSDSAAIEHKTWVLISYGEEGDLKEVLEGTEITAEFILSEATVRGSSGCNHYFGNFEVEGSELSVSSIGYTEMYCLTPDGVMEQEQLFISLLGVATGFEIRGDQLIVFSADDQILKFK